MTLTAPPGCTPTRADVPANYKADAPVRNKIGAGGYVIEGIVMRLDCTPVADARIEFWHVNSDGNYDDDHRATTIARRSSLTSAAAIGSTRHARSRTAVARCTCTSA